MSGSVGQRPGTVLVARCESYREDVGAWCKGRIRFWWGHFQAACDTCGGYCGVAVATWERVELGSAPSRLPTRSAVLAVLPHDVWCKAGGSQHADCCRDEMASCACVAAESVDALVAAGLIEVRP